MRYLIFLKNGYESKHNVHTWQQREYLGFGIGASSYFNNIRFKNINNLPLYIDNMTSSRIDIDIEEVQISPISKEIEYMFLGLRMVKGISEKEYIEKFGKSPFEVFKERLNILIEKELLKVVLENNDKYIRLTDKGLDLAGLVWQEFII